MSSIIKHDAPAQQVAHPKPSEELSPAAAFASIFNPPNRDAAVRMCVELSKERWLPRSLQNNPMLIGIALAFGERFGLQPMASLTNIAVINGKPSLHSDMALAVCKRTDPTMGYKEDYEYSGDGPKRICVGCTVTVTRDGCEPHVERFTKADAERANLWGKEGPWTTYPQRMLMFRARGFALRTCYPDVLSGYITSEEAQDYPTAEERAESRKRQRIAPHPKTVVDAEAFHVKQNETSSAVAQMSKSDAYKGFIAAILDAGTTAELRNLAEQGKDLGDDEKAQAKNVYKARQAELRESEKQFMDEAIARDKAQDQSRSREVLDKIMTDEPPIPELDEIPTPEEKWGDE